jgi:hypothetical protein
MKNCKMVIGLLWILNGRGYGLVMRSINDGILNVMEFLIDRSDLGKKRISKS